MQRFVWRNTKKPEIVTGILLQIGYNEHWLGWYKSMIIKIKLEIIRIC